jgi:hypothetical protein
MKFYRGFVMLSAIAGVLTAWFAIASVSALGIGAIIKASRTPQRVPVYRNTTPTLQRVRSY